MKCSSFFFFNKYGLTDILFHLPCWLQILCFFIFQLKKWKQVKRSSLGTDAEIVGVHPQYSRQTWQTAQLSNSCAERVLRKRISTNQNKGADDQVMQINLL